MSRSLLKSCLLAACFAVSGGNSVFAASETAGAEIIKPQSLPQSLRPFASRVNVAIRGKRDAKALNPLVLEGARLLKTSPRGYRDELFYLMGVLLEGSGRTDEALKAFDRSLELRSNNPGILLHRARLFQAKGDCPRAMKELADYRWQVSEDAFEALTISAQCSGDGAAALPALEKALKLRPDSEDLLRARSSILEKALTSIRDPKERARTEEALIRDLNVLIEKRPDEKDPALSLAQVLLKRGDPLMHANDYRRAEVIARKYAEKSNFSDERAVRLLLDAQLKRGDVAGATETLQKGLAKNPKSELLSAGSKQLEIVASAASN